MSLEEEGRPQEKDGTREERQDRNAFLLNQQHLKERTATSNKSTLYEGWVQGRGGILGRETRAKGWAELE